MAWDPTEPLSDWYEEGRVAAAADTLEIRDPFFEFAVSLVEGDSLGVWTRERIESWIAGTHRRSQLPIDRVISLSRLVDPERSDTRIFRLELDADLALPLPYSILGYHPGTLHVSRIMEAREYVLPEITLRASDKRGRVYWAPKTAVLVIEHGHVILDVDGWIDKLLGKKLDDTWFEAFVVSRVGGDLKPDEVELNGLALGRSRNLRPLSGAFDFRRDKVLPNGLPIADALDNYCRRMLTFPSERAWTWKP